MDTKNKTKVLAKRNGPIIITGAFIFDKEEGEAVEMERIVLCRCGASNIMPLCDASHNRVGFCSK
jgi:CDGSH-type Zn-finger protein